MRKIRIIFVLSWVIFSQAVYGQVKLKAMVVIDYSYGFASGDLDTYIPEKTFDGLHFQYRHFKKRDLSLGVRVGWNSFKTKLPRAVYETDRGTVSAVQNRYFHSVPVLITGFYYLRSIHYVMPYIGGGLGGYYLRYEKYFGVVPERHSDVRFGISPEAGVVFPFKNTGLGLVLCGRYTKVFYKQNEIDNLNYFEASLGVYIGYPFTETP